MKIVNHAIIKDGKIICDVSDKYVANKKEDYCKGCESQFAGVCRFDLDRNY